MPRSPVDCRGPIEDQRIFAAFLDQLQPAELIPQCPPAQRQADGQALEPGGRSGGARASPLNGAPWRPVSGCPPLTSARAGGPLAEGRLSRCQRWLQQCGLVDSPLMSERVLARRLRCGIKPSRKPHRLRDRPMAYLGRRRAKELASPRDQLGDHRRILPGVGLIEVPPAGCGPLPSGAWVERLDNLAVHGLNRPEASRLGPRGAEARSCSTGRSASVLVGQLASSSHAVSGTDRAALARLLSVSGSLSLILFDQDGACPLGPAGPRRRPW